MLIFLTVSQSVTSLWSKLFATVTHSDCQTVQCQTFFKTGFLEKSSCNVNIYLPMECGSEGFWKLSKKQIVLSFFLHTASSMKTIFDKSVLCIVLQKWARAPKMWQVMWLRVTSLEQLSLAESSGKEARSEVYENGCKNVLRIWLFWY